MSAILATCFAALWLPVNNGVFEGPTVAVVARHHGLSSADLLSVSAFTVSLMTLGPRRWPWLLLAAGAGAAVAWATSP
jgi:hypothetical protein